MNCLAAQGDVFMKQQTTARPFNNHKDAITKTILDTLVDFSALERKVFVLYHYAGNAVPQIADETGLSTDLVLELIDQTNRELMQRLRPLKPQFQIN
jgi:DNA-directed RNA polymerase specialized sigma24 family protein